MKDIRERQKKVRWVFTVRRYIVFFLMMAFVISCCMILFLNMMSRTTGLVLTKDHIEQAAKVTFLNVILLSLICSVIDGIRRRFMVDRPVRRIVKAAEQIMKGDFAVRIPSGGMDSMSDFSVIADYFNKMAQELSGTETLRTDFIANVSHELKTPLAVIQNYGTLLQQPDLPEKKNLEINTDVEEEVMVDTDAELLALVWNNLFSNAVKFTDPGGKLFLSLKSEGDYAIVQVTDTGCGIPPEVGRHIFEKFYQGDTSHASQGNGLGLALVKRVIDIVGGDISVSSQVGKGSTFTVKLRRKQDEAR